MPPLKKQMAAELFNRILISSLIMIFLNYRDDYEQRLAQRKQFFNPENGDAPSMQSLEDSSRITNMGLLVKASIVLTFTGYTLSKALKLTPINPRKKTTSSVHQIVVNIKKTNLMYTKCAELVVLIIQ